MISRGLLILLLLSPATSDLNLSRSSTQPATASAPADYDASFRALYEHLGRSYPGFRLKHIDWPSVGSQLLPEAQLISNDQDFGLLCMRLVARLEDAHAQLQPGSAPLPEPPFPKWDPGLACLMDDRNRPVVYYLDPNGPAARAGVSVGMTVITVDDKPAPQAMEECSHLLSTYIGYSSDRHLAYDAVRMFLRRPQRGQIVRIELQDIAGQSRTVELRATMPTRYLPRLPVPIPGIRDAADFSHKRLRDDIGYIYIRRMRPDLPASLDRALSDLKDIRGLILDLRGNSGGAFDGPRALRNFNLEDGTEPLRPRCTAPIALLIDSRCISAGEGWASWFVANKRARLFGSATAGASSRKNTYTLPDGRFRVVVPVKLYKGFLNRPIERQGLEPDVPVRNNAADLAAGKDTVLEAARRYLLTTQPAP